MSDRTKEKPGVAKVKAKKKTGDDCKFINSNGEAVQKYILYFNTTKKRSELDETTLGKISKAILNYEFVPGASPTNSSLTFTKLNLLDSPASEYYFPLEVSLPEGDVDKFRENSPRLCQVTITYSEGTPDNLTIPLLNDF